MRDGDDGGGGGGGCDGGVKRTVSFQTSLILEFVMKVRS
jgi:hypothetical protein